MICYPDHLLWKFGGISIEPLRLSISGGGLGLFEPIESAQDGHIDRLTLPEQDHEPQVHDEVARGEQTAGEQEGQMECIDILGTDIEQHVTGKPSQSQFDRHPAGVAFGAGAICVVERPERWNDAKHGHEVQHQLKAAKF
jgi:hypothetical protein